MSAVNPMNGEMFRIVTKKNLVNTPDRFWTNTWEVIANDEVGSGDLQEAAMAIANFELAMLLPTGRLSEVIISTWVPNDASTQGGAEFVTVPVSEVGLLNKGDGEPLSLRNVLKLRKMTYSGRNGRLALRHALKEGNVTAPAGKAILSDPSEIEEALDAAFLQFLTPYVGVNAGDSPIQIGLINAYGAWRPMISLQLGGVGEYKTTRTKKTSVTP